MDGVIRIQETAKTSFSRRDVSLPADIDIRRVTVPGTGFTFQSVVAVIRLATGAPQDRAVGELVLLKDETVQLVIRLSAHEAWSGSAGQDRIASVTEAASEYIVRESQPYVLARYFYETKRITDSQDLLHRVMGSDSRDDLVAAYNLSGIILSDLHRPEEATKEFQRATEVNPLNACAWTSWGIALRDLRQPEEAIKKYKHATEVDPKYADAWNHWGVALSDLHQPEEAIEKFKRATELDPKYAGAWNNWGVDLRELHQPEEAIKKFQRATELDPNYVKAWDNWASLLCELGRTADEAEIEARRDEHTKK